ncbi:MAG: hypothetical protein GY702_08890 [Desulfobulbaceae bacterium]|nr:hypothetical protein [Desulfobulbaceae bacterium]
MGYGKWRVTESPLTYSSEVHAITRGGLSHKHPETEAQPVATLVVMRKESAEAIVGVGRCQRQIGVWKRARRIEKPGVSPH